MRFDSLSAALQMDGHGPYVWAAVLVSLVVVCTLIISPLLRKRRVLAEVAREMRREAVRREQQSPSPEQTVENA